MTDPTFDELASAHLDGATTPEEDARIAGDPALRARVEELRSVRAALAQVPPVDPVRREAAIAAALSAFQADEADASRDAPTATVTSVAARRGPSAGTVRVLGAAAAVVLLALLVPLLGRLARSSDDDSEASFDSTGSAIESAPGAAEVPLDRGATTTTAAGSGATDLGDFADVDALVIALSARAPAAGFGTDRTLDPGPTAATACPPAASGPPGVTTSASDVASATATVGGEPVIVVIRTDDVGVRTVVVHRAADCAILAERPL